jgi:hypothetical protein
MVPVEIVHQGLERIVVLHQAGEPLDVVGARIDPRVATESMERIPALMCE